MKLRCAACFREEKFPTPDEAFEAGWMTTQDLTLLVWCGTCPGSLHLKELYPENFI
jgi:hypothetical protein